MVSATRSSIKSVALVTGGTAGIGQQTAAQLAALGYHVILTSRTHAKGQKAIQDIQSRHTNAQHPLSIEYKVLDLTDFESIQSLVDDLRHTGSQLNVLVANAGSNRAEKTNEHGIDSIWVGNYLGHYHLIRLLVPLLKRSSMASRRTSRVVVLSSVMHRFGTRAGIVRAGSSSGTDQYAQSKLALTLLAFELQRRYASQSVTDGHIISVAVNPGAVNSEIWRHVWPSIKPIFNAFVKLTFLTPAQGAATSVYAATGLKEPASDQLIYLTPYGGSNDGYEWMNGMLDIWYPPFLSSMCESRAQPLAYDIELARTLWTRSEEQVRQFLGRNPHYAS